MYSRLKTDEKVALRFVALTFCIAYGVSGVLIALGQFGYRVYGLVDSIQQFAMNIPFAVYILSMFWKYGEELRLQYNAKYHYEGTGVVNPAIFSLSV